MLCSEAITVHSCFRTSENVRTSWERDLNFFFDLAMKASWLASELLLSQSQTPVAIQSDCLTVPWAADIGECLLVVFGRDEGPVCHTHERGLLKSAHLCFTEEDRWAIAFSHSEACCYFPGINFDFRESSAISARIDAANASRAICACNSTLTITCWPAAVYLLSCSLAVCCVIEFGWPEGWKAWGG